MLHFYIYICGKTKRKRATIVSGRINVLRARKKI
jgi:hypothetical protein